MSDPSVRSGPSQQSRLIAIGDIHGCLKLLEALLTTLSPQPSDTLIFLGDMVDRGADSKGVIDRIMSLESYCKVISICGNHEEMMLGSCSEPEYIQYWLRFGGAEALASFGLPAEPESIALIPEKYTQWLRSLIRYHETEDFIFCHGAPHPETPLAQQKGELRWRFLQKKDSGHCSGKTVVCGHSEQRNGEVWQQEQLICIDTYAHGGGNLTALEIVNKHTGKVWQVSANTELKVHEVAF